MANVILTEFGPCLSPNVADHSLKSATDRCLGGPLPLQLANRFPKTTVMDEWLTSF